MRRRWDVALLLFGTLAAALTIVPAYAFIHGYETWLWAWFLLFMLWNGLSITAGYHRLWSHKSYDANPVIRFGFALGGALSLQNSIKEWCSNHRKHHRWVDDVDKDPYSAERGFFFSHVGWMLKDYPATEEDYSNVKDLERDPIVNWQYEHYWSLALFTNVILPLIIGFAHGDIIGGLLLVGVLRLVLCHHATFFINSLAHAWGKQPYSDGNTSKDNGIIAFLTYGEGYHNFHHTFQWDYRNGIRWYQFDPTKWLIRGLSLIGLTSSLKIVEPDRIERSLVAMQLKRTSERISHFQPINTDQWLALLNTEYAKLIGMLNEWSECREEWLALRKARFQQQLETAQAQREAIRGRLRELEEELNFQRRQWRLLTRQFA
jgi:stearoyl-CoA desaturase (delta-9 desaturase)